MATIEEKYQEWKKDRSTPKDNDSGSVESRYQSWKAQKSIPGILDRVNAWLKNSDTYAEDHNLRYKDRKGTYEDAYVPDSGEYLERVTSRKGSLDAEYDSIMGLLDQYGRYYDSEWADSVRSAMNGSREQQDKILRAAESDRDYWGQFTPTQEAADQGYTAETLYGEWARDQGYRAKYNGISYDGMNKLLGELEDGEEKQWLYSYIRSTPENRQRVYADNQARIEELGAFYDEAFTVESWYNAYKMNPSVWDDETVSKNMALYDKLTGAFGSLSGLGAEISRLETENRNYNRGNNGEDGEYYGSRVVDDYQIRYAAVPDLIPVSERRDFAIRSREELDQYDAMMDSTTWDFDENGVYRDAFGNALVADESRTWTNPTAEEYAAKDRLGVFLNASEKELEEVAGTIVDGTWGRIIMDGVDGGWEQLTKDEINIYYYILNSEGPEAADQYLTDMETELNRRQMQDYTKDLALKYQNANFLGKVGLNVATVPAQLFGGLTGFLDNTANILRGEEINPYASAHTGTYFSQTVRGETAAELDKIVDFKIPVIDFSLGDFYQSGMSVLDSFAAMGIGGKLGGVLLATGAASSEAMRLYEQGASIEQIGWGSAAAGAAELIFESISIDKLIDIDDALTKGQIIRNLLVQGGIEASEEGFTEIASILTNAAIMGSQSDWNKLVDKCNGDKWKAFLSKVQDVAKASFGGFLSGAGSAAIPSAASYAAKNAEQQRQYTEDGRRIMAAEGGVEALKGFSGDIGKLTPEAQKKLNGLSDQVKGEAASGNGLIGKAVAKVKNTANAKKVGKLLHTTIEAVNAKSGTELADNMVRRGMKPETARKLSSVIMEAINAREMTDAQADILVSLAKDQRVTAAVEDTFGNKDSAASQRQQRVAAFREAVAKENTALTEDGVQYSLRGKNENGIEVYETSQEVNDLSYKERAKKFQSIMRNEYRGRTAKFQKDGQTYYAQFEDADIRKNIYGDKKSDHKGRNAKISAGAEGDIFELVENADYYGSSVEQGKTSDAHKGVSEWDYFVKTVQIDDAVYDLVANVRKNDSGEYVYSIQLNENKKIEATPLLGSQNASLKSSGHSLYKNSISESGGNVNGKDPAKSEASARKTFAAAVADQQVADALMGLYREGDANAEEISAAFEMGYGDFSVEKLRQAVGGKVTETVRKAYEAGRQYRAREDAKRKGGKAPGGKASLYYLAKDGKVAAFRDGKAGRLTVTGKQSVAVKTADFLHRIGIGGNVYFFESYEQKNAEGKTVRVFKDRDGNIKTAPNGIYYSNGDIYIDINAGMDASGITLTTLAHELVHYIQQWSGEKYRALAEFLAEQYEKKGVSAYAAVKATQKRLTGLRGEAVTFAEAYHEWMAESLSTLFNDGKIYDRLLSLKKRDSALYNYLKKTVDRIARLARKHYSTLLAETPEARFVQGLSVEAIEALQQKFADALVEAGENHQKAENTVASSEIVYYSKRNHSKPIFKENVFPPYNESQSDTHELAERWSGSQDTKPGDERLVSHHGVWYRIEAFEDMKYGYQITKKLTAQEYKVEAKYLETITRFESLEDASGKNDQMLRRVHSLSRGRLGDDYDVFEHGGKDNHILRVGADETRGRQFEGNSTGSYARSSSDRKGTDGSAIRNSERMRPGTDSKGRSLSVQQQEFFKESVVVDANGRLLTMYHGTSRGGFTVFDVYGSNHGLFGMGLYFTDNQDVAQSYTKKGKGTSPQVYEVYLNIKNPMDMDAPADPDAWAKAVPDADFPESGTNEEFYRAMEQHLEDEMYTRWEGAEYAMETISQMGYDGITHIGGGRVKADGVRHRVYIAFEQEQVKEVSNEQPTDDYDIYRQDRMQQTASGREGQDTPAQRDAAAEVQKDTAVVGGGQMQARNKNAFSDAEIQTIQNIGRISIHKFTAANIKATEKLAQRYWQEMGTNSPFFRAWFGDWRVNDKIPIQVANVKGDTRGVVTNEDTQWNIQVSGKVFVETRVHTDSYNIAARPYLRYINDIVKKAVLLDTYGFGVGDEKSQNSLLMHSLYAVADIGNGPEILKLYVEEMNNPNTENTGKRAYQLQNVEKYQMPGRSSQKTASFVSPTASGTVKTVADLFAAVKKKDAEFNPNLPSKIVNADGTPKVMYHGSPAQFTIFDKKKAKGSGLYGRGFYFTDSSFQAGVYGNQYAVYLNIRNPLQPGGSKVTRQHVRKFLEAIAENEDYSIENYGTYDVDAVLQQIMGKESSVDAFQLIQDINATAIGDMVEAAKLYNDVNGTKFDGIVVPTETVAFEPTQIKFATDNIGTFDGGNPDIRYQDRMQQTASGREAFAQVLDGVATTDADRLTIERYREAAEGLARQERRLNEINAQIREITYGTGTQDSERLRELRLEASKARNRAKLYEDQLAKLEHSQPYQKMMEDVIKTDMSTARRHVPTETAEAAGLSYEVSEDGVSDGAKVRILGYAQAGGAVALALADGRIMDADQVKYKDEGDAIAFETIGALPGIDADGANQVLEVYRSSGAAGTGFSLVAEDVYNLGYHNIPESEIRGTEGADALTKAQLQTIYEAGRQARQNSRTQSKNAAAGRSPAAAERGGVYYGLAGQPVDIDSKADYDGVGEEPVYALHQPGQDVAEFDHGLWAQKREGAKRAYGLNDVEASGVERYVFGNAYEWNAILRGVPGYERTEFFDFWIQQVINGLRKIPQFAGRTYRNLSFANRDSLELFLSKHQAGMVVDIDYFASASKDPNGYGVSGDSIAHMVIDGVGGRDISDSYAIPGQQEVICLPGTKLRITDVRIANDGHPLIYAQEVKENGKILETNHGGNGQGTAGTNNERRAGNVGGERNDHGGVHSNGRMEGSSGSGDAKIQRSGDPAGYGGVESEADAITDHGYNSAGGGVYYGYEGQRIGDRRGKKLSRRQRVGVDFAQRLADSRGMTFYFYESYLDEKGNRVYKNKAGSIVEADNGCYDPNDRSIHIDLNAGEFGQGTVLFTIAHELVHFIKDSPIDHFYQLADILMKGYARKGQSVTELVRAQQARAKSRGDSLTFDEAYDEVIADSMEGILADGRVAELMRDIEGRAPGLGDRLRRFFRDIAKLLKDTVAAYRHYSPETPEGKMVMQMEDIRGRLQEVLAEGIYQAGENVRANNIKEKTDGNFFYSFAAEKAKGTSTQRTLHAAVNSNDNTVTANGGSSADSIRRYGEIVGENDPAADIRQKVHFSRRKFGQDVDTIVYSDDSKPFDHHNVFIGETPRSLLELGFAQLPMTITSKHIYTIANAGGRFDSPNDHYHELGADGVKNLPDAIKEPIVTFVEKDNAQRVIMITKEADPSGNAVMVAIACSGQTNYNEVRIYANPVTTAFGKKSNSLLAYIEDALEDGRVLQANKKRSQEAPSGLWAQCPEGLWSSDFTTNIERFKKNVKRFFPKEKQIRRAWQTIKSEQAGEIPVKRSARSRGSQGMTAADIKAVRNVGRKRVNAFTAADIKATERFAQQYWREMGEKSPFFRAWFGDWRANDQTRVQVAKQKGDTRGVQRNTDTGWDIQISGKVFSETRNHTAPGNRAARPYLPYINDITEKAVLLDSCTIAAGAEKSPNSLLMHSLYAVADIGGGPGIIKLYIEEMNDPNREDTAKRAYQLQDIEISSLTGDSITESSGNALASFKTADIRTVADLFAAVKQKDPNFTPKDASAAVNDDGTPRAVYRGFPQMRTATGHGHGGSVLWEDALGAGLCFTDNRELAEAYGGDPEACYLQMKTPYIAAEADIHRLNATQLQMQGYDSVILNAPSGDAYIVFGNTQVKSATDNMGTFDGSSRDIRRSARSRRNVAVTEVLQAENAQLREDVAQLKEMLKLQRQITGGTRFTRYSVEQMAGILARRAGAKGNKTELAKLLNSFYEAVAAGRELTWETVKELAQPAVDWLQGHTEHRPMMSEYARDILTHLRTSRIYLDERQRKAAAYRFGGLENFHNAVMGSIILANDSSTALESLWQQLSELYPDMFEADTAAADMPGALVDAITRLRNTNTSALEYEYNRELIAQELLRQVYDSYWNITTLKTVADVKQKQINRLKYGHIQRMEKLRQDNQARVERIKADHRAQIAEMQRQNRENAQARQKEIARRYQESRQKAAEGRHRTEMRHKIQRVVKKLENLLLHESRERHIPDSLKKAVSASLEAVDMAMSGHSVKFEERTRVLKSVYDEIRSSTDPVLANAYDEVISAKIQEVIEIAGETPLYKMSMEQLEAVYDMYKMVAKSVGEANKAFKTAKGQTVAQLGAAVEQELSAVGKRRNRRIAALDGIRRFSWNNLKPIYAFERIGSKTLLELYQNIRRGEDIWAADVADGRRFRLEQVRKYGYDSWDTEKQYRFTSTTGKPFELTLEQIMSLYAYSKREAALEHLEKGGFVFDSAIEAVEKRKGIPVTYKVNTAAAYNLSAELLADITSKLTAEQMAFVDAMQDYLSSVMGEKGNEVSLELYDVRLFKEKHYFPLRSARQYLIEKNEAAGEIRLKNSGFSKKTAPHASNPVILNNFTDVWASHVQDMSLYHGFVLPLEDFNRVFNFRNRSTEVTDTDSVKAHIQDIYGAQANEYIRQMLTDINGGAVTDPRENAAKKLTGKYKKAAVLTSLSVVIQQPSSIGRAFAVIDPKYFVGGRAVHKKHEALWAELKQYAPVAVIKEMGYFDTSMGRTGSDFIKSREYTGKEKLVGFIKDGDYRDEALSRLPALADEYAWCAIWEAVKRETRALHPDMPVSSGAFLEIAGSRFTDVITRTQVYDSVLSRSANMRSHGWFMNAATSFMAEPTTAINMLEDAVIKAVRGDTKQLARTLGAVFTSNVLNSLLVSLVYAMRDDDEDETFPEKYLQALASELLEGSNPLTYYPVVKDVWSALQGFDVERSDMSLLADLADVLASAVKTLMEDTSDMDEDDLQEHGRRVSDLLWKLGDSIASLAGFSLKNVRRDINAIQNTYDTIKKDMGGRKTTRGSIVDSLQDSVMNALPVFGWMLDESKTDKLYDAVVSGDAAYVKRFQNSYGSQTAYATALRKGLREHDSRIRAAAQAKLRGDLRQYSKLVDVITGEGHFSESDVVRAINSEISRLDPQASATSSRITGKYRADDFAAAISKGDLNMAGEIQRSMVDNYIANGKSRDDAETNFKTAARNACKELYQAGGMKEEQALAVLEDFCGKTDEEAFEAVQHWAFQELYPEYEDLSASAVAHWYDEAQSAGIALDVYYDFMKQKAKCKGVDRNGDGKADSGTKKKEILALIRGIEGLTYKQRKVLKEIAGVG